MNIIICGEMKEGKTTLAQYLAAQHSPGVAIWDPRNMIDGVPCYGPEELQEAMEEKLWREGPLCYRFDSHDIEGHFHQFCSILFPPGFTKRQFAVVIDEAAQLQSKNSIHPALDRAIRQHPRDVVVIQTAHSLQDWHRASKDLMNHVYSFRQKGRSLQAIVDYCDESSDFEFAIRDLPQHHCVHYSFERGQGDRQWTTWNDPKIWYVALNPSAQAVQQVSENEEVVEQSEESENGGITPPVPPVISKRERYLM